MKTNFSRVTVDLAIIVVILILSFLIFSKFDVLEKIVEISAQYEEYEVDEILSTLIVFSACLVWFSVRRWREAITSNKELQDALLSIKKLEGIIPICMHCKEIRDDKGSWNRLEKYISENSEAQFSHSICNECLRKYHPEDVDLQDSLQNR